MVLGSIWESATSLCMCYLRNLRKINKENQRTQYKIIENARRLISKRYLSIINEQTNKRIPDPYDL